MTQQAVSLFTALAGRHAVVTGGGSGIGAAIATTLAAQGARVTVLGRRLEALQAVVAAHPGAMQAVAADITDAAQVDAAFAQARAQFGAIDILVNNAGQAHSAPFAKTDLALWQQMLDVNLTGTFVCTQAALGDMLTARWGRIVNVASTAGLVGYAYVAAYVAAKHGVIGLTKALALEVAKKGITVNAVCPGYTETEILRESIANVVAKTGRSEEDARAEFAKGNPQGRIVQPQEVADTVAWLCLPGSAAIHGQSIAVCGGEVMA
ncbi:SDR family NAD(P)-dependent oxidoreductase [Curvibacter sp. APW13]|uniref:SDR family NAD(P)-dependent oxidoreductase n=1 Tax=Curvibacter sp. APW13 TaxID=3077236 RepID=UPI0028DD9661|nr:SDR family NAD(P)-dependent oxidoreductase [Curvibacter sp. APW13]MDT8992413.1 SDR family NAD(P)-dependent oxidoreductase [Curvibacter sp. APW13]